MSPTGAKRTAHPGPADLPAPVRLLAAEEVAVVEPADARRSPAAAPPGSSRSPRRRRARSPATTRSCAPGRTRRGQRRWARPVTPSGVFSTDGSRKQVAATCPSVSSTRHPIAPTSGRAVEVGDRGRQHVAEHHGVGVEEQHVAAVRATRQADVARRWRSRGWPGLRTSATVGNSASTMSAEPSSESLSTTITSPRRAPRPSNDRRQAGAQVVDGVPAHDDDGQVGSGPGRRPVGLARRASGRTRPPRGPAGRRPAR